MPPAESWIELNDTFLINIARYHKKPYKSTYVFLDQWLFHVLALTIFV